MARINSSMNDYCTLFIQNYNNFVDKKTTNIAFQGDNLLIFKLTLTFSFKG